MTVISFAFLIFLFVTFALYYICPIKFRWLVLLVASICFYVFAGASVFLPFIIGTSFIVWICSVKIGHLYVESDKMISGSTLNRKQKKTIKRQYQKKAKLWLILAIVLWIGYLCVAKFTKYLTVYLKSESFLSKSSAAWIIIPLGISYYTFSTIGYILDVYWHRYSYEKSFLRFLLYTVYFPHFCEILKFPSRIDS